MARLGNYFLCKLKLGSLLKKISLGKTFYYHLVCAPVYTFVVYFYVVATVEVYTEGYIADTSNIIATLVCMAAIKHTVELNIATQNLTKQLPVFG